MAKKQPAQPCFVIAPIGDQGSPERAWSDKVLRHIIKPVVTKLGYQPTRADEMPTPGIITQQVIERLVNDPLVIADLTGYNANVFYELAVRHAAMKPVVLMIQQGSRIPFDINQNRTIQIDISDPDILQRSKRELRKQIVSLRDDPSNVESPISNALASQLLRQSAQPSDKTSAEILESVHDLRVRFQELQAALSAPRSGLLDLIQRPKEEVSFLDLGPRSPWLGTGPLGPTGPAFGTVGLAFPAGPQGALDPSLGSQGLTFGAGPSGPLGQFPVPDEASPPTSRATKRPAKPRKRRQPRAGNTPS
jgi:hypothetical protein